MCQTAMGKKAIRQLLSLSVDPPGARGKGKDTTPETLHNSLQFPVALTHYISILHYLEAMHQSFPQILSLNWRLMTGDPCHSQNLAIVTTLDTPRLTLTL